MATSRNEQDLTSTLMTLLKVAFFFGGLMSLAVGVWMLASPAGWYDVFPGSIPDTGPLNQHFVRDLGGWYVAGGLLMLFAFANPPRFGGVALVVGAVTNISHAAVHVSDIITGRLGPAHWVIDLPLVFAPVALWGILIWIWIRYQGQSHPTQRTSNSNEDGEMDPVLSE